MRKLEDPGDALPSLSFTFGNWQHSNQWLPKVRTTVEAWSKAPWIHVIRKKEGIISKKLSSKTWESLLQQNLSYPDWPTLRKKLMPNLKPWHSEYGRRRRLDFWLQWGHQGCQLTGNVQALPKGLKTAVQKEKVLMPRTQTWSRFLWKQRNVKFPIATTDPNGQ